MSYENRRFEGYCARGFWPVRWAHHPPEIKAAIRAMGFRPLMKQCYRNCQLFVILNERFRLGLDVEYREGWATSIIPIEHAWLVYHGEVLDLTLGPDSGTTYQESTAYTPREISRALAESGCYGQVDWRALSRLHPFREQFSALAKLRETAESGGSLPENRGNLQKN